MTLRKILLETTKKNIRKRARQTHKQEVLKIILKELRKILLKKQKILFRKKIKRIRKKILEIQTRKLIKKNLIKEKNQKICQRMPKRTLSMLFQ